MIYIYIYVKDKQMSSIIYCISRIRCRHFKHSPYITCVYIKTIRTYIYIYMYIYMYATQFQKHIYIYIVYIHGDIKLVSGMSEATNITAGIKL